MKHEQLGEAINFYCIPKLFSGEAIANSCLLVRRLCGSHTKYGLVIYIIIIKHNKISWFVVLATLEKEIKEDRYRKRFWSCLTHFKITMKIVFTTKYCHLERIIALEIVQFHWTTCSFVQPRSTVTNSVYDRLPPYFTAHISSSSSLKLNNLEEKKGRKAYCSLN
jgi:hypothetical protein